MSRVDPSTGRRVQHGLSRVTLVGDPELLTNAHIREGSLSGGAAVDHRAQGPEDP